MMDDWVVPVIIIGMILALALPACWAVNSAHKRDVRMALLGYEQIMDVGYATPVWRKAHDWR